MSVFGKNKKTNQRGWESWKVTFSVVLYLFFFDAWRSHTFGVACQTLSLQSEPHPHVFYMLLRARGKSSLWSLCALQLCDRPRMSRWHDDSPLLAMALCFSDCMTTRRSFCRIWSECPNHSPIPARSSLLLRPIWKADAYLSSLWRFSAALSCSSRKSLWARLSRKRSTSACALCSRPASCSAVKQFCMITAAWALLRSCLKYGLLNMATRKLALTSVSVCRSYTGMKRHTVVSQSPSIQEIQNRNC